MLLSKILKFADEYDMLPQGGVVLVCVSGGADSMCLLEAMRHISYQRGFELAAAHYNHRLRGEESDRDETFVMNVCETHGIPLYSNGGDVARYAKQHGLGIEEAARDMRYNSFYDTAQKIGASKIATAHTMNDNTETVLMNLVRGTGTNGLGGIPPVRGDIIRPLLCCTRQDVLAFLTERNIGYMEDSSNALDIYTRNKIRHSIIPLLKEINPRLNEASFTAAELSRADEECIQNIADIYVNDHCMGSIVNVNELAYMPFAVSSRVIKKLYGPGTLSYANVKDVLALCRNPNPSASLSLPGMVVYREYDQILFNAKRNSDDMEFAPVYPKPGDSFTILGLGLTITCKSVIFSESISRLDVNKPFTTFFFKSVDICGKITIRPRREGDMINLKGRSGSKTLKKLFIEERIPARERALIPIICDDEGVLGIYGIGVSSRAVPKTGETAILINIKETI